MAERALSERALNRALLARQMLLERRGGRLADAVDRLGGLQTQYAPFGYIGLWSRLDGFARADLTRALERRAIVQGTIMRATIHMVSAADYPLLVAGVRDARRDWWLKAHRNRIEAATVAEAAARARALLADGPLRRTELVRRLGVASDLWNGIGLWVDLLRAPPPGTWEQRRADLYVAAGDWLEPTTPQSLPTFLVDGRVAGSWRYEDGRVVTTAFEPLPAGAEREVAAEAERLAAFMA